MMKLADILGYQLDMARCAALRSLYRLLGNESLRPADTAALALVREQPGCNQTTLGRALAGNRSVGMKVASRLEARGLLTRCAGRDARSKGLFLTPEGERALDDLLARHAQAEARLSAGLTPAERRTLLRLLGKVQQAVAEEEDALPIDQALKQPRHSRGVRKVS
jgi:DNA-binding MarR family transcriptional regulator